MSSVRLACLLSAALLLKAASGQFSYASVNYNGSTNTVVYGINKIGQTVGAVSEILKTGQTAGIAIVQSPTSKPLEWIAVDQYIPGYDLFQQGQSTKQITTGGTPEFVTLDSTGTKLFVADRFYGRVTEYSFPAMTQLNTFNGGAQIYGVATDPSGTFH